MKDSDSNSVSARSNAVKFTAVDVAECGLAVALMIVGAFIHVNLVYINLTFQTVFAVLIGLLLGWKKGMISITAYAIMGLIGIPVFSSGGGIYYVIYSSFGFILGFIAAAGVAGIAYNGKIKLWKNIVFAIAAFVADYAVGIPYLVVVRYANGDGGLWAASVSCFALMPKDAILSVLAAFIAYAVAPTLKRMRGKNKKSAVSNAAEQPEEAEQSEQN